MIFNIEKNDVISCLDKLSSREAFSLIEEYHRLILACFYTGGDVISCRSLRTPRRVTYSLLMKTNDNKFIMSFRNRSFAFENLLKISFDITSVGSLFHKMNSLYKSFTDQEKLEFNSELRKPLLFPARNNISIYQLLKLLMYNCPPITHQDEPHTNEYLLPGGQTNYHDRTIEDTCIRESREELSLPDDCEVKVYRDKFVYLNIFDRLVSKFFHNVVFFAEVDITSHRLQEIFKPNCEVSSLLFVDVLPPHLDWLAK
jgi:hypothetical protein